jgi:nucleotide-binding universal stress UspA family protein
MSCEPMGPVVVGIDGSPASLGAVGLAAEEAAARVTPLLVVNVYGGDATARAQAREFVSSAVELARSEHPGVSVAAEVIEGRPADGLLSRSLGSCLLVVGHRGRCRLGALAVGSVALEIIDRTRVPVMVHRPVDTTTEVALPRPVLIGVRPGQAAEPVVEFGFAEASLRGAPLHAMYVWAEAGAWELANLHVNGFVRAQGEAERTLAETLGGWSAKYPDVAVHSTVRHSLDATIALTAASRSAQLVVVGSSPPRGVSRVLAGSVAHALVHRAGCPVVVIDAGPA